MGYPVRYRGGRSPQRGTRPTIPVDPPIEPGPWAAGLAAAWLAYQLGNALRGAVDGSPGYVQTPAGYGWTPVFQCAGMSDDRLPAAARAACGHQIVSHAAWASEAQGAQNPRTATQLYYWDRDILATGITGVDVNISSRWTRGTARNFSRWTYAPPGILLGGPLAWRQYARALGASTAGYDAPAVPVPGRLPGFDILDNRWTVYWPGQPGTRPGVRPGVGPIPRPVARAVPATGMREVKFNANTRAGRMFFAMYATFNLLGDGLGFTRALWFSLPSEKRGGSMRFRNMANDIWQNWQSIDPLELAKNIATWKFLDTLYGGTQAAMFNAIAAGYGYPLARVWSTLQSEIEATVKFERKKLEREQESQRGG